MEGGRERQRERQRHREIRGVNVSIQFTRLCQMTTCTCTEHRHYINLHVVEDGEYHTKQHLDNSKDDGHLHLVGVGVDELVVSNTPDL